MDNDRKLLFSTNPISLASIIQQPVLSRPDRTGCTLFIEFFLPEPKLTTGSALTLKLAKQHKKSYQYIDFDLVKDPVPAIKDWILEWNIEVLNVAGRKASKASGIYDVVKDKIMQVLK